MKTTLFSILTLLCAITLISISSSKASGQEVNLALKENNSKVTAKQSSSGSGIYNPEKAIDGISGNDAGSELMNTLWSEEHAWFQVDLGDYYKINRIVITPPQFFNSPDCIQKQGCGDRFKSFYVMVADRDLTNVKDLTDYAEIKSLSTFSQEYTGMIRKETTIETQGNVGRFIRLQIKDRQGIISLSEIKIFGEKMPISNYTPRAAATMVAFDPNYPNLRGLTGYNPFQASPKIVGVKNSSTGFDIAFQDNYVTGKDAAGNSIFSNKIYVNTYEKAGNEFKKTASTTFDGLGTFGGFAKDASNNKYVFTGTPWTDEKTPLAAKVFKNNTSTVFWNAKYYDAVTNKVEDSLRGLMKEGTSRLVFGKDPATGKESLLVTTNLYMAHPYQVILDTQNPANNGNRALYESLIQHNFGQRAIFDGKDFVIMEDRDHDVSVTLSKLSPNEVLPLSGKNDGHSNEYSKKVFSVYSHTNFGNNTYTELGDVEKGLDDGYLVLFAGERDWDNKMAGYTYNSDQTWAPKVLSPRDIGLIHVKKDFNTGEVNWVNSKNERVQCPPEVNTTKLVNSTGTSKPVKYKVDNDGWDWNTYNCSKDTKVCVCRDSNPPGTVRSLVTSGVKWVTKFGESYTQKAPVNTEFDSVSRPKLVRIASDKYIVLWEEWKASRNSYEQVDPNTKAIVKKWEMGEPEKTFVRTRAAVITLVKSGDQVDIQSSEPVTLDKARLMPADDAFEFEGKAAWAVGDAVKNKLMFYTIGADLKLNSYELEL